MNPISPGPPEPYISGGPLNPISLGAPEPYITVCPLNPISMGAPESYITACLRTLYFRGPLHSVSPRAP